MQREILNQVATGQISASEGASRLEGLVAESPATASAPNPAPAGTPARQVKVTSRFGMAEIVGDPSVAFAVADGPHSARQDGDTMIFDQSWFGQDGGFSFGNPNRAAQAQSLVVRMNPDLALFAKIQAGHVRIAGVHGPITGEVLAGNCEVGDFRGPLNLVVQAGELTASGRLESGSSSLRCQMGDMKIRLEKGSSVRITARSTMGDVSINGDLGKSITSRSGSEVVVGTGEATLVADCTMGTISLTPE